MSGRNVWRAAAVAALVAVLIVALGCESGSPTAPQETPAPAPGPVGSIGGTVTINGAAFTNAWVQLQRWNNGLAVDRTSPSGSWEREGVATGDYDVVILTPLGITCDAMRKPATIREGQRTVVSFSCSSDVKAAILGFTVNEFGAASARITLTGSVNRETTSNQDGFFAFDKLPAGEYVVRWCSDVRVSVRDGATAFAMVDCS